MSYFFDPFPSLLLELPFLTLFDFLLVGRQLDFARSGIEILAEVMHELRKRDLLKNGFEV